MTTTMTRYAVHAGFIYDPRLLTPGAVEKLTDRALMALAVALTPGYLTPGGIEKTKTGKQRQIDEAKLDTLLRLMVNDLHIRTADGYTESALRFRLAALGADRGVLQPDGSPFGRPARDHGPWALWDVMTDERRDREEPGRRTSARGCAPRY
jgi:hypothetical protein